MWIKSHVSESNDLNLTPPEPIWWKERSDLSELPGVLHTRAKALMHTFQTHIHTP